VKQLVANPPKPLTFRAAILESEAAALPGSGLANWQALVAEVGCSAAPSQIDCVRAVPAATIKNIIEQQLLAFAPVSDQVTASSDVRSNFITHKAAQVPLFFGSNSQEGRVFAAAAGLDTPNPPITSAQFLNATFPGQPAFQAAIAAAYPADVVAVPYLLASAVITDATFTCPISALSTLARLSGYDVWRYYFNASFPNTQLFPNAGVYHASEIPEVFGTYPTEGATAQEINLSTYMQRVWAHFAKHPFTGIPWPELGTNRGVELGDLGGNGIDGEKTIPLISVDYICAVYAPLIAVQGL
jgi:carboxylesterase 2